MPVVLSARERAELKARAHMLEPVVQVGQHGATDAVVAEVDRALTAHELLKVKIADPDRDSREATGDAIAERTDAVVVQRVGRIVVLFRPRPDES